MKLFETFLNLQALRTHLRNGQVEFALLFPDLFDLYIGSIFGFLNVGDAVGAVLVFGRRATQRARFVARQR